MIAYVVPSPLGHNLVRASVFVLPLVLVAAALAGFRPRGLTTVAVAAALAANVLPYAAMISNRSSSVDSRPSFWAPVVDLLHARAAPGYRVEVVPTANHWEAYYMPRAGLALARGWCRQLDIADDAAMYARYLTAAIYELPHAQPMLTGPRLRQSPASARPRSTAGSRDVARTSCGCTSRPTGRSYGARSPSLGRVQR